MKKTIFTIYLIIAASAITFAQAPNAFKYQAIAYYANGESIVSQPVGFRISILQGSTNGTALYTETHTVNTNAQGLVNLETGNGTTSDDMSLIDWANGPYFIKVEMDTTGGSAYNFMGTSQLLSVPYALYANNIRLSKNNENLELYINDAGELLAVKIITDTLGLPCSGAPTVTDYEGNIYNTVQIGAQCWMKENLKTTNYSDGTPLIDGTGVGDIYGDDTAKYWFVNNDSIELKDTYGLLYTWAAVMNDAASSSANPSGVQGICPTGWHVPSDAEWTQVTEYLGNNIAGGRMKEEGTAHWNSPNSDATNLSGFSALPGGNRYGYGYFYSIGYYGYWWSATEYSTNDAWTRGMSCSYSYVYSYYNYKVSGFAVRCVRD